MTALYVAITNHGFGHATRTAAVVAEVQKLAPELPIILVTTAPRWLLEGYIPGHFIHRPRALDIGVVQADSLQMDRQATLDRWQYLRDRQAALVRAEVEFIQQNRVGLILADIPPLAALIGQEANIPCWMMSNFGWDLIYREWGGEFIELADWIADCFHQATRLFRLPFHEPMSAFRQITDVGLTGGTPRLSPEDLRAKLQTTGAWIGADRAQTVLLTFGGLGLERIPYENVDRFPDWQFITFDADAPNRPNLFRLTDRGYRPVDLMPICGRVLSKPGYSTFSEACRMGVPLISLTRQGFAEASFLLQGIQHHHVHQIVETQDFFAGNWSFLQQAPNPPQRAADLGKNGHGEVATAIVQYLSSSSPVKSGVKRQAHELA